MREILGFRGKTANTSEPAGISPTKNPDVTADHGPSMMLDPTWFRLVSGGIS
jgi:hypothetical protein